MIHTVEVETVSGKFVNVVDADPSTIQIDDIAWALSRIARFAGHTITVVPYTVGQHSVFVSDMILEEADNWDLALFGLLHDAAESFIGDIPSPVKRIPGIKEKIDSLENDILNKIFIKYVGRLPSESEWDTIHFFDKKAQFIEAHAFLPSRGKGWLNRENYKLTLLELQSFPAPTPSVETYKSFLAHFEYIIQWKLP